MKFPRRIRKNVSVGQRQVATGVPPLLEYRFDVGGQKVKFCILPVGSDKVMYIAATWSGHGPQALNAEDTQIYIRTRNEIVLAARRNLGLVGGGKYDITHAFSSEWAGPKFGLKV